jgi:hypothetical protein
MGVVGCTNSVVCSNRRFAAGSYLCTPRVASDGTHVGWLDHVRYEQHADHPDEIVVRRRGLLLKRRRAFPFSGVETVRQRERTVVLRLDRLTPERSPSS